MIDSSTAREIAVAYLERLNAPPHFRDRPSDCVLLDQHTQEEDFGWIFFYNSRRYIGTGDIRFCLLGNAPLIVNRQDGSLHVTGTAYPMEHYINEYRELLKEASSNE